MTQNGPVTLSGERVQPEGPLSHSAHNSETALEAPVASHLLSLAP